MRTNSWIWVVLWIGAAFLTMAAKHWPYFFGDVAAARLVQSMTPADTDWAQWVSATAKSPAILIVAALTVGFSGWIAGWRGALAALASFAGMWVVGLVLGPVVARPRPTADLIRVTGKLSGYSFPSVFALNYASTFGFLAVLFARETKGLPRLGGLVACCAILLIGWSARIALGAHWTSDVLISYWIGLLWAASLVHFV